MTDLVLYDQARAALAACVRIDEVKDIRDKAEAMAHYSRQAKNTEMIEQATEIKVRAERKCGELTAAMEKTPGRRTSSHDAKRSKAEQLEAVGISVQEANRFERLAAMPEEHFETAVATAKAAAGQVTTAHMLRAAKAEDVKSKPKASKKKAKPEKPSREAMLEKRVAELEAEVEQLRDSTEAACAAAQDLQAIAAGDGAKQLANLRAQLKATEATRDQYLRENAQLKRQVRMHEKRQA